MCERILGDSLERLLDIDCLLRRGLKVGNVAFRLTPGHRALLRYLTLALLHINLVTQNNEWERLWVTGRSLNEELIPPTIKRLE